MGSVDPQKLAALPGLFKTLMASPLKPLNRGRLPQSDALYVLYQNDEPVRVGCAAHLNEGQLLASSVRIGVSVAMGPSARSAPPPKPDPSRTAKVLHARWISIDDPLTLLLLETYAGQSLGVSISHPKLIAAMLKPRDTTPTMETISD